MISIYFLVASQEALLCSLIRPFIKTWNYRRFREKKKKKSKYFYLFPQKKKKNRVGFHAPEHARYFGSLVNPRVLRPRSCVMTGMKNVVRPEGQRFWHVLTGLVYLHLTRTHIINALHTKMRVTANGDSCLFKYACITWRHFFNRYTLVENPILGTRYLCN